ncbi:hypothetical protein ACPXB3_21865 [Gordonia sp. DT219]|uniref:hypothetical protein n=1 Tax=Gordonia sp. DT219 TaxID=3416658 RepID=UPI003CEF577F
MCTYEQLAAQCATHNVSGFTVFNHLNHIDIPRVSVLIERGDDYLRVREPTADEAFESAHNSLCADLGWYTPYDAGLDGELMRAWWSDASKEEWRRGDHDRIERNREAS